MWSICAALSICAVMCASFAGCGAGTPGFDDGASLTAEEVTTSEIAVSWPAADGATGYAVRLDGEPVARLGADVTSYRATSLDEGSEHTFELRAIGDGEVTSAPLELRVTTADESAPVFPEGVLASLYRVGDRPEWVQEGPNPRTLRLTWPVATDNVAVARYRVMRDGEELAIVEAPTTEWVVEDVDVTDGVTFEVRALDAAGNESVEPRAAAYAAEVLPEVAGGTTATEEAPAPRMATREAQRQVEHLLLGALGSDQGAFADVLAGGSDEDAAARALFEAGGVGLRNGGERQEAGGGGRVGGLGSLAVRPADRSVRARVEIVRATSVDGARRDGELHRVLRTRLVAFRACHERALRDDPTLAGEVAARVSIGTTGSVERVEVQRGLHPPLDACVARTLHLLHFVPQSQAARVEVTLRFAPAP